MMGSFSYSDKYSLSDEALIEMLQQDHEWALKEIFTRYHFRLFSMAAGVLDDDDLAKDIVQDIFIDLWNRRQSSQIQVLKHYLFKAVKFQVLKNLKYEKLQDRHLMVVENLRFANQTEESLDHKELDEVLQKAVGELSPRCKEVFELSRFENLSHKEISSRLKISTKTVEAQIGKALAILRQKLQQFLVLTWLLLFS